jgi:hypothetical protein
MAIDSLRSNIFSTQHFLTKQKDDITTKIRQTDPNEIQYNSIDEMDPTTLETMNDAVSKVAETEKFTIVAQGVMDNNGAALVAINKMRQKISEAFAATEGYNPATMTPERLSEYKAVLNDCLTTMSTQLNQYNNGYIFGTPKDTSIKPVNEAAITLVGNVSPDGSLTDSFVYENAKSEDKIVAISSTTSVGTAISASNLAFVDSIGGIWGILNTLNAAAPGTYPDLPQASIDTLNRGINELTSLTTKVKDNYDLAKAAIVENQESQDNAKQSLDNMKINTLDAMQKLQLLRHITNVLMALETSIMQNESKITDTIAAAAR